MKKHDTSTLPQLEQVAQKLYPQLKAGDVIFLRGDLGMGKTTFTQFLLKVAGVKEHIKSPTYTLFEQYQVGAVTYVHMDLYRLSDPEELYFLGIEDLINPQHILIIEWPEKGTGVLPKANKEISFGGNTSNRTLTITSN
ncbi:tRNA (adenosine(37)-N6)-threonylcarbamoyltransferase complex ATPase subunit type 1 TsaE [Marinicella rhabdoformis]|uniref:tRNA (adenosine(37)-N6)-threonylcarbamoyltransferase complex ATPase subunit type 1 TsaE n=1 Tax=Marinicella rhabdoformis TaxID=2580566 RepID=UPI0012AEB82A|nr:tRNA (adenosine(37)-N6)-threonylcarbamoyltransferase complex ATPase subunit type 1 TsaE [Marinicella rhabdoformis]